MVAALSRLVVVTVSILITAGHVMLSHAGLSQERALPGALGDQQRWFYDEAGLKRHTQLEVANPLRLSGAHRVVEIAAEPEDWIAVGASPSASCVTRASSSACNAAATLIQGRPGARTCSSC